MQETEKRRRGHPKSEGPIKDKTISFRMLESRYRQIKKYSQEHGKSITMTINEAIDEFFQSKSE